MPAASIELVTHARLPVSASAQPLSKEEFSQIFWPASMHAIGHVAANLSFAAVAISLTHTVKTLEPAFNVVLSRVLLGAVTPPPVIATLVPIMVRSWDHPLLAAGAGSAYTVPCMFACIP